MVHGGTWRQPCDEQSGKGVGKPYKYLAWVKLLPKKSLSWNPHPSDSDGCGLSLNFSPVQGSMGPPLRTPWGVVAGQAYHKLCSKRVVLGLAPV